MPVNVATPQQSPVQGKTKQQASTAPQVAVIPFSRAAVDHVEMVWSQSGILMNLNNPQPFNIPINTYGYLAGLFITVAATGGSTQGTGGVSAVGFEDAPWSVIQQIQLSDVNGAPILLLSGYEAYLAAKFGGYRHWPLDGSGLSSLYHAVDSNGNFNFVLPIFVEFGRDGLGSLANMDASARYTLQITLPPAMLTPSATGPLYTQGTFTANPTLSITVEGLYYSNPPAVDMFGNPQATTPPANGTIQFWSKQTFTNLGASMQTPQLTRVGNYIRNHILVFRDASTQTRAQGEKDLPLSIEFDWDTGQRYIINVTTQRQRTFLSYGFDVPAGVIVFPYTLDPDYFAGTEYGDQWMPTLGSTKLVLRFTPTASVNLTVLTNDVVPASAQVFSAPALQLGV